VSFCFTTFLRFLATNCAHHQFSLPPSGSCNFAESRDRESYQSPCVVRALRRQEVTLKFVSFCYVTTVTTHCCITLCSRWPKRNQCTSREALGSVCKATFQILIGNVYDHPLCAGVHFGYNCCQLHKNLMMGHSRAGIHVVTDAVQLAVFWRLLDETALRALKIYAFVTLTVACEFVNGSNWGQCCQSWRSKKKTNQQINFWKTFNPKSVCIIYYPALAQVQANMYDMEEKELRCEEIVFRLSKLLIDLDFVALWRLATDFAIIKTFIRLIVALHSSSFALALIERSCSVRVLLACTLFVLNELWRDLLCIKHA